MDMSWVSDIELPFRRLSRSRWRVKSSGMLEFCERFLCFNCIFGDVVLTYFRTLPISSLLYLWFRRFLGILSLTCFSFAVGFAAIVSYRAFSVLLSIVRFSFIDIFLLSFYFSARLICDGVSGQAFLTIQRFWIIYACHLSGAWTVVDARCAWVLRCTVPALSWSFYAASVFLSNFWQASLSSTNF